MPTDDIVKRLNNLLQFKTALESTNVSPQYLSNETARRDAIKLEKQGNQIDLVTKKPKKYSEKYLQSTGQQIPGLDSEGTSAMNALDLIGLPGAVKLAGTIGREGIKRGIGRVATNLVSTTSQNVSENIGRVLGRISPYTKTEKVKKILKAIVDDKAIYPLRPDEVPYRMMFGLKPRKFTEIGKEASKPLGTKMDDYYAINPDKSLRFKPNTESYKQIQERQKEYFFDKYSHQNVPNYEPGTNTREFVMGHYNHNFKNGHYYDKWDVALNPGELKNNLKAILSQKTPEDIYALRNASNQAYNSIPSFKPDKVINSVGEIDKFKLATEKTKSILKLLERAAVRKTVDMFSDPVILKGTIKDIGSLEKFYKDF